jgi:hypothetical protein
VRAFRRLVAIRAAFWLATAIALVWSPPASRAPERTGSAIGDFLFGTYDRWDAQWFLQIARHGYDRVDAAFFPLYPLVLHLLGSSLVWGTLLSLAAGGLAAWAVAEIAPQLAEESVLLLALFPTAYVFTAVYSDGLFLALSAWSFLFAQRGQAGRAGVAGGLACATRLVGLALLPALLLLLWRSPRKLPALALLPAAVAAYAGYLQWKLGDAFAFSHAQVNWERSTPALGPLTGLWWSMQAAGHGARDLLLHLPAGQAYTQAQQVELWNVVHLVVLALAAWLTWVAWTRVSQAAGLYSLATLVLVLSAPSRGFPLVSLPRFLLADFPIVLAAATVVRDHPRARHGIVTAFAATSALASVAFSRGGWIA